MIKNRIFDKNWIFENNQLRIGPRRDLDTPGVREFTSVHSKADWIFIFWILNLVDQKYPFLLARINFKNFRSLETSIFFLKLFSAEVFLTNGFSYSSLKCFLRQWKYLFLVQQYLRVVLRVFLMVFACSPIISFPFYGFARCLNL